MREKRRPALPLALRGRVPVRSRLSRRCAFRRVDQGARGISFHAQRQSPLRDESGWSLLLRFFPSFLSRPQRVVLARMAYSQCTTGYQRHGEEGHQQARHDVTLWRLHRHCVLCAADVRCARAAGIVKHVELIVPKLGGLWNEHLTEALTDAVKSGALV